MRIVGPVGLVTLYPILIPARPGAASRISYGTTTVQDFYTGFECGPIRPPNEARSLLVRVTRNCPWNRCAFCPVYKTERFSVRTAEHVKRDIDLVHRCVEAIEDVATTSGKLTPAAIQQAREVAGPDGREVVATAVNWVFAGEKRLVFLQDADALAVKPVELVEILQHLRKRFPSIERITSYSRAKTIYRRKDADLRALREAGLDRIHIGLESGSDEVLAMVDKGSTKSIHIEAGLKVHRAGMELSEYVMPGLGGRDLSQVHARETADAMNQINPHFIRLRTLALTPRAPLYDKWKAGEFDKCTDLMVARELLAFIEHLEGVDSVVASDHVLNLFEDLEGKLPDDKPYMLSILRTFLGMDTDEQRLYQTGRRLGVFRCLTDLENAQKVQVVENASRELGITPANIDDVTDQLMARFV